MYYEPLFFCGNFFLFYFSERIAVTFLFSTRERVEVDWVTEKTYMTNL